MKKSLIVLSVVLVACVVMGSTYTVLRGNTGFTTRTINFGVIASWGAGGIDTSKTAIVDTSYSDTVNISGLNMAQGKGIWMTLNIGAVVLCDSCNDSVIVIRQTMLRNRNSLDAKLLYADTIPTAAQLNGASVTTVDETSKYRYIPADSLYGDLIYVRTIIKDAVTHAFTDTLPDAAGRRLVVPTSVEVLYR